MIDFMKYRWLYFAISLAVIIPGVFSLLTHGLKLGVDFTGGTLWEVKAPGITDQLNVQTTQAVLQDIWVVEVVQPSGDQQVVLRGKTMTPEQHQGALQSLQSAWGPVTELRFTTIGPILGSELIKKTIVGIVLAASCITIYVWRQFKQLSLGFCAILAMLHDILVVVGIE